jgi:hypothetical protein
MLSYFFRCSVDILTRCAPHLFDITSSFVLKLLPINLNAQLDLESIASANGEASEARRHEARHACCESSSAATRLPHCLLIFPEDAYQL